MYYQGDYYQGDYYRGDPFLGIGSLFGLAAKGIGSLFKKKATQAIATRAMPGLGTLARRIGLPIAGGAIAQRMMAPPGAGQPPFQRGPIRRRIERILPGGRTGFEVDCKPGQYMQKRDFVPTGKCLYRKMNVTNSSALRRSLRRVAGFGKLASRTRRDVARAATAVGVHRHRAGPVARHHAKIRRAA